MKVRHRIMLKRAVLLFSMTQVPQSSSLYLARVAKSPCPKSFLQPPSEVQAKSVGEVVLAWNTELESRTVRFPRLSWLFLSD